MRLMRRVPFVALLLVPASMILRSGRAGAVCSTSSEEQIFVREQGTTLYRGNTAYVANALLGPPYCAGDGHWATTFVDIGDSGWRDFMEIGFLDKGGTRYLFSEIGVDGDVWPPSETPLSSMCNSMSNVISLRVVRKAGTNDWRTRVDCLDGTGYHTHITSGPWGSVTGKNFGETSRWSGSGSPASDDHSLMKHRTGDGSWIGWPGQFCDVDTLPGYVRQYIADDHYKVVSGSGGC